MTKPFGVLQHKWPCYLVLLQPPYYTQAPVIRLAHQKICIIIIYCQHIGCLPLNFTQRNWLIAVIANGMCEILNGNFHNFFLEYKIKGKRPGTTGGKNYHLRNAHFPSVNFVGNFSRPLGILVLTYPETPRKFPLRRQN